VADVHADPRRAAEVDDVRWAFWRSPSSEPQRPLPDDVGLPTRPRPAAATPDDRDGDDDRAPASRTSGATPTATGQAVSYEAPLAAPAPDLTSLVDTGPALVRAVTAARAGATAEAPEVDLRTLAVAATGVLAARLPALSGADVPLDEPQDELLHAYADLLVSRAERRRPVDRDDLLAVAHLAAAAAAVGAADEPALLLLAGVSADDQVVAAVLLLAQTADDGGDDPERLAAEVRDLFQG
jgi:hypothetical protein